jgi:hypothetical protein
MTCSLQARFPEGTSSPWNSSCDEARARTIDKNPLIPFVIFFAGRIDLAPPIVGKTHAAQLGLHVADVFLGPNFG